MINRYSNYLEYIDVKLKKMFDNQSQYIKCKKGCSYCCKEGEFPMSELEFIYLMINYMRLPDKIKDIVNENISTLLENKREKFYQCPFLIDNECSVYPNRPLICRTFGLIYYNKNERFKIPFCVDLGLNYSEVYSKENEKINSYLLSKNSIKPIAFNIERSVLRSKKFEKQFNLFFGEDKSMVDWLKEEF